MIFQLIYSVYIPDKEATRSSVEALVEVLLRSGTDNRLGDTFVPEIESLWLDRFRAFPGDAIFNSKVTTEVSRRVQQIVQDDHYF